MCPVTSLERTWNRCKSVVWRKKDASEGILKVFFVNPPNKLLSGSWHPLKSLPSTSDSWTAGCGWLWRHFSTLRRGTDGQLQPAHYSVDSTLNPALRIIVSLLFQYTIPFLLPFPPRSLATMLARPKDSPLLGLWSWRNNHISSLSLALQSQHSLTRNSLVLGTLPS